MNILEGCVTDISVDQHPRTEFRTNAQWLKLPDGSKAKITLNLFFPKTKIYEAQLLELGKSYTRSTLCASSVILFEG